MKLADFVIDGSTTEHPNERAILKIFKIFKIFKIVIFKIFGSLHKTLNVLLALKHTFEI